MSKYEKVRNREKRKKIGLFFVKYGEGVAEGRRGGFLGYFFLSIYGSRRIGGRNFHETRPGRVMWGGLSRGA